MPILNLSKMKKASAEEKKDGEEEPKGDAPDELPSLPAEGENKEGAAGGAPAEGAEGELAPDELPPIEHKEEGAEGEAPAEGAAGEGVAETDAPAEEQPAVEEAPAKVLDERLYFSKLIKRLNDGATMDEIESEIKSKDIVSLLKKNVNENKREIDRSGTEKSIKSTIAELQKLEKEWAALKLELDSKKARFKELEGQIKEKAADIKKRFVEREALKQKQ